MDGICKWACHPMYYIITFIDLSQPSGLPLTNSSYCTQNTQKYVTINLFRYNDLYRHHSISFHCDAMSFNDLYRYRDNCCYDKSL